MRFESTLTKPFVEREKGFSKFGGAYGQVAVVELMFVDDLLGELNKALESSVWVHGFLRRGWGGNVGDALAGAL
jgi:hypothetical protein